jgi:hypothetical protein
MRYIESDQDLTLRGDRLLEAIAKDKDKGLIPFFVSTDDFSVAGNRPLFEPEKKCMSYILLLNSRPSSDEVKNGGAVPPLHHACSWCSA